MMSKFKKFIGNGGGIKVMLWLIFLCVTFLLKVGWRAAKFDGRITAIEASIAKDVMLKESPILKSMDANLRMLAQKMGVPRSEITTPSDFQ